jgi:hypothetical protein
MKSLFAASLFIATIVSNNASNIFAQGKLEIMIVPTAQAFNYKSPTRLAYGAVRTYTQRMIAENIYKRERTALGHGVVRALCFTGEEEVDFWSGFNGNKDNYAYDLAKNGAGLSVILYDYHDGYIQSTEFIHKYLNDIIKQPRVKSSFIRINVNQEQCRMIKQHFDEFNRQDTLYYGFFSDAQEAKGAGCTSYVTSYAQRAGVFPQFLEKNWTRHLDVSLKLLGPTDKVDEIDGHPLIPVSILKFLNPIKPVQWKNKGDKVISFSFFDPQLMVEFMRKSVACLEDPAHCNDRPDITYWLKENKAKVATNEYMKGVEITLE